MANVQCHENVILSQNDSNIIASIIIYCRKNGFNQTATLIDQHVDISNFTKYTSIEKGIEIENGLNQNRNENSQPESNKDKKIKRQIKPRKLVEKKENEVKNLAGIIKSKNHTISYLRKKILKISATKAYPDNFKVKETNKVKPVCIVAPYRYNPFKKENKLPRRKDN